MDSHSSIKNLATQLFMDHFFLRDRRVLRVTILFGIDQKELRSFRGRMKLRRTMTATECPSAARPDIGPDNVICSTLVGVLTADLLWDWIYIDELWVDEHQRSQGIGKASMKEAEDYAASHRSRPVE